MPFCDAHSVDRAAREEKSVLLSFQFLTICIGKVALVEGLQRICVLKGDNQLNNRKGEITQTEAKTLNFILYRILKTWRIWNWR